MAESFRSPKTVRAVQKLPLLGMYKQSP